MNKKQYTHVFWDWNGTIIDDLDVNFDVINILLSKRKKNIISMSEYRSAFSFPIKDFYNRVGLPVYDEEYEILVYDYWNLYKSKIEAIPLMVGVKDILSRIKENGVKQYILSASDKNMIFDQMSIYGIQSYFEEVIAPQDGYALGKIELAKFWLSTQGIFTPNVIMIGDTIHDYETAQALGIDCALVDKGHQDLRIYKHDSKITIFDNLDELKERVFL